MTNSITITSSNAKAVLELLKQTELMVGLIDSTPNGSITLLSEASETSFNYEELATAIIKLQQSCKNVLINDIVKLLPFAGDEILEDLFTTDFVSKINRKDIWLLNLVLANKSISIKQFLKCLTDEDLKQLKTATLFGVYSIMGIGIYNPISNSIVISESQHLMMEALGRGYLVWDNPLGEFCASDLEYYKRQYETVGIKVFSNNIIHCSKPPYGAPTCEENEDSTNTILYVPYHLLDYVIPSFTELCQTVATRWINEWSSCYKELGWEFTFSGISTPMGFIECDVFKMMSIVLPSTVDLSKIVKDSANNFDKLQKIVKTLASLYDKQPRKVDVESNGTILVTRKNI